MLISHIEIDQVKSVTARAYHQNGTGFEDIRIYRDGKIMAYSESGEWELDDGTLEEIKRFVKMDELFPKQHD